MFTLEINYSHHQVGRGQWSLTLIGEEHLARLLLAGERLLVQVHLLIRIIVVDHVAG